MHFGLDALSWHVNSLLARLRILRLGGFVLGGAGRIGEAIREIQRLVISSWVLK